MARRDRPPRRKRSKPWLGRTLVWLGGVLLVVVVGVVVATPWVLRSTVPDAFARLGLEASVTGGRLNPLRGEITLTGFVLGPPDAPALSFGELGVGLGFRALLEGRVKLRHLRVQDVRLDADRLLELVEHLETGSAPGGGSLPVELDQLALSDVSLVGFGARIGHDTVIEKLEIRNLEALLADGAGERPAKVVLDGRVGQGSVGLDVDVTLDDERLQAKGTYALGQVPAAGWTRLALPEGDPVAGGVVTGRGEVSARYGLDDETLGIVLDGRVSVTGLDMAFEPVRALDGEANWQGRLTLDWPIPSSAATFRGNGDIDVEKVRLEQGPSAGAPFGVAIEDISWHGSFDIGEQFTAEGGVLGTSVIATDGSGAKSPWRVSAEDFSSRLHARPDPGSAEYSTRIGDFDLARLAVTVDDGASPVAVVAERIGFDELRSTLSGQLFLGTGSVETVSVEVSTWRDTQAHSAWRLDDIGVKGMNGDFAGRLHAAHLSATALDARHSGRRLYAESIVLASAGFRPPGWAGAGELQVESARIGAGDSDVWLSGITASRLHGDAGGGYGAERFAVAHGFEGGTAALRWDATEVVIDGIGTTDDATTFEAARVKALKVRDGDVDYASAGLSGERLRLGPEVHGSADRLTVASAERKDPGTGTVRLTDLAAGGLAWEDASGSAKDLKAARLEVLLTGGDDYDVRGLEAWELAGDAASGVTARRLAAARAGRRGISGVPFSAAAFEAHRIRVETDGTVAVGDGRLGSFRTTEGEEAGLALSQATVAGFQRRPRGLVSATGATVGEARYARADGTVWALAKADVGGIDWDGDAGVQLARARIGSGSQTTKGKSDWHFEDLHSTDAWLKLPGRFGVATVAAASVGGDGAPAWRVRALSVRGLDGSRERGQSIETALSGPISVTDSRNGAALDASGAAVKGFSIGPLGGIHADSAVAREIRMRSTDPDWPSRLKVAELGVTDPDLGVHGLVALGEVIARSPYLIVAQSEDDEWMWPPVPGLVDDGADAESSGAGGGLKVARFSTRGAARVAYIDREPDPPVHLVVDPVVVAIQNFDSSLPGNVSRFRARGNGSRFSTLDVQGELTKGVDDFDISVKTRWDGADLPVINPYLRQYEPFDVTAGRGDVFSSVQIESGELTGEVNLLLSGLQLRSTLGGEVFTRIDPASFPIRTALALLKDREGNIRLQIPLEASTGDPTYDFVDKFQSDFVETVKAAGQAAGNLPGKTIDGAVSLLERAVSVLPGVSADRYDPVEFSPGSDRLRSQRLIYLDQLAERMKAHDTLVIGLCGRAVGADAGDIRKPAAGIDTLFAKASAGVFRRFAPDEVGLLALADARADVVRDYLREIHKVPSARLEHCAPEVDETGGEKPRVDLKIVTPARRSGIFGIFP